MSWGQAAMWLLIGQLSAFALGYLIGRYTKASALRQVTWQRDKWMSYTKEWEASYEKHREQLQKWIALACRHEPDDPYTTLTPARERDLLSMRLQLLAGVDSYEDIPESWR